MLTLELYEVDGPRVWPYFAPHHYMSENFHGHKSWIVVTEDGEPVAFTSIIRFPHGHIENGWRGHRTVVLPDFQGLGIGGRLTDWTGEYVVSVMGGRYFSRTVHPRFGAYRDASPLWVPTSTNRKKLVAPSSTSSLDGNRPILERIAFSHEYVGASGSTRTRRRGRRGEGHGDRGPTRQLRAGGRERQGHGAEGQRTVRDATSRLRLRPYQRVGSAFLVEAGSALLGDDMGVGKTGEVIRALQLRPDALPALVVCPNTVKRTWARELEKWAPELAVEVADSGTAKVRRSLERGADVTVVNYEALSRLSRLAAYGSYRLTDDEKTPKELNRPWGAVVMDEAHRIKDPKAKVTRAAWAIGEGARHRYAMTGTPVANRPDDLWSIMRFVAPDEYPGKTAWVERYVDTQPNFWSGWATPVGFKAETRAEFDRIFLPRFLRRTREQVLPDLPPVTRVTVDVELAAKQRKAYDDMAAGYMALLDTGALIAGNPLTQLTRLRQFASAYGEVDGAGKLTLSEPSSKLDAFEDVLEELGGRQVVVFAEARQLIEMLEARLLKREDVTFVSLTGATPEDIRQAAIDVFQQGYAQCFLTTIGAGGEGIDGLQVADTAVFLQRTFSQLKNTQAEARVHRSGQERPVTIVDLVTVDTIEQHVLDVLQDKAALLEDLVRDTDTLRRWLS